MRVLAALLAGLVFGLGLALSQMTNPAKVLAFLDVFGAWDPSLLFVMGGALGVAALGYRFAFGRDRPLFAPAFQLPAKREIDARLLGGSALFGVGWGLTGLCPGPALAAVSFGGPALWVFLLSMAAGMALYEVRERMGPSGHGGSFGAGEARTRAS